MKLIDLIQGIDAKILTSGSSLDAEIKSIYASDRMSDLVSQGAAETLLVTNLTGAQIFRVAQLMDVPAICLLNGILPEPELTSAAETNGTVLLVSPLGMFETCGRLYACFTGASEMRL